MPSIMDGHEVRRQHSVPIVARRSDSGAGMSPSRPRSRGRSRSTGRRRAGRLWPRRDVVSCRPDDRCRRIELGEPIRPERSRHLRLGLRMLPANVGELLKRISGAAEQASRRFAHRTPLGVIRVCRGEGGVTPLPLCVSSRGGTRTPDRVINSHLKRSRLLRRF